MAKIWIPATMQTYAGGQETVEAQGATVYDLVESLGRDYPQLLDALLEDGELRKGIAVAVDGYITSMGLYQRVKEHSDVQFVPAIGGG